MTHLVSLPRKLPSFLAQIAAALYLHSFAFARVLAGFGGDMPDIQGTPQGGANQTRTSVVKVINFILTFLALLAVIFIIVGGFRILMAGGNEENVTKGRKTIIYAIIGLVIIFFARVIVGFFTGEIASQF